MSGTKEKFLLYLVLSAFLVIESCTKDVPKEFQSTKKEISGKTEMPDDSIHRNISQGQENKQDQEKADKLTKEADDADAKYQSTKTEADKKEAVEKQMAAANFMMFEANLSPKKKYRTALKRYRRVLEIDPNNEEAARNKKTIEDIYRQMGMPIPD
jgi:tetratricopeptide (TPR) repeat protein